MRLLLGWVGALLVECFVPSQQCGTQSAEKTEDHAFTQETPTCCMPQPRPHPGVTVPSLRGLRTGGGTQTSRQTFRHPRSGPPQGSTDQQGNPPAMPPNSHFWAREEHRQADLDPASAPPPGQPVTRGKGLNIPEPQFPHLQNGESSNRTCLCSSVGI